MKIRLGLVLIALCKKPLVVISAPRFFLDIDLFVFVQALASMLEIIILDVLRGVEDPFAPDLWVWLPDIVPQILWL